MPHVYLGNKSIFSSIGQHFQFQMRENISIYENTVKLKYLNKQHISQTILWSSVTGQGLWPHQFDLQFNTIQYLINSVFFTVF